MCVCVCARVCVCVCGGGGGGGGEGFHKEGNLCDIVIKCDGLNVG